jgi:pimeloyl-ACP methyl ester carboxylesterase
VTIRVLILAFCALGLWAAEIEGLWQGAVQTPAGRLRLGLTVRKTPQGYVAALDSIDQGVRGIPVDEITLYADTVKFSMARLRASFEGKVDEESRTIEGTFTQGASLPLRFERVEKFEELTRPQEPKPPFPYASEEVTVVNALVGVKLAGTVTRPRGAGPFPALVMLTGSGPQNRNEEIAGHKPFWVIADALTRRGYLVLRMDDRGVGGSGGNLAQAAMEDLAQDARAAVAYLKGRADVNKERVGILGHSEGALVAPMAAGEAAFLVLLAAPAVRGREIVLRQNQEMLKRMGVPQAAADQQVMFLQRAVEAVVEAAGEAEARAAMDRLAESVPEQARAMARAQLGALASAPLRSFLKHDPAPVLRKVKVPVLALYGDRDTQVLADQNYEAARAALKEAGNAKSEVRLLPGLNHLLQTAVTGLPGEYAQIAETVAPRALEEMGAWLDGLWKEAK